MSDFKSRNDIVTYLGGGLSSNEFDSLPIQLLPRSKKNDKWKKHVMDSLENIGLQQIRENRVFADYRKMRQGRLVYADFDETQTDLRGISAFRKEQSIPTFLKHYDLIGRIINLLAGEFNKQKDTINIYSTDIFSTNEYLMEKDSKIRKFTEDYFNKVLEIGLIEKGIDPFKQDFNSEEERQAYLEQLKAEKDQLIPPDKIERDLNKNFKTAIVEWAEHTLESNYIKFSLDMLDTEEILDYLSTGRYFRNYYVGYDSYKPETWDIERTFISQDQEVLYPKDCEYVGTIHLLSGAKLLSRFGHLIPKNIQNKIYGEDFYGTTVDSVGPLTYLEKSGGTPVSVPHAGYYQEQVAQAYQNLLGIPWGQQYYQNEDGDLNSRFSWVNPRRQVNSIGWGKIFRDDINVRTDQIQVTEAYFRSKKLMGLLTVENPVSNTPYQTMVEEDLIPEVLEYYNIKKQSTKSWQEVVDNPLENVNTITYGFVDEIWKGHKINASSTNLKEDYYFGIEPLKYQITDSDDSVIIPVGGIITSGIGEMIRSLQIDYNIVMNQNRQYLEKTIGTFFLMDWNLLPSEYKNENGETSAELVEKWREDIRELGFGLTDSSPMNTRNRNPNQNNIQAYDISFINNIQMNMNIARDLEEKAFSMIGITRERAGNPNEYMTAEGVKVGQDASYAQTEVIYKRFNTAKIKEKQIELAIAQYAEANKKDISINYVDNQNRRIIRNFTDPNFSFRKLEVYPSDDSNKRKELETMKTLIMNNNTMDNDIYDLAKIVTSDNFVTLLEYGLERRERMDKKEALAHERTKEIQEINNAAAQEQIDKANAREDRNKQLDRDSAEYQTEIKARATLADNNLDPALLDKLMQKEKEESNQRDLNIKNNFKQQEIDLKKEKQEYDMSKDASAPNIEFLRLREESKNRKQRETTSRNKVAATRINSSK